MTREAILHKLEIFERRRKALKMCKGRCADLELEMIENDIRLLSEMLEQGLYEKGQEK